MRRTKVQRAVLGAIALAGIISVALVAPNAVELLRVLDRGMRRKFDPKYAANAAFWKLVERGFIALEDTPRGKVAKLTQEGQRIIRRLENPSVHLKKPKRWDGKWRILIFDISEKRRWVRDQLRIMLTQLGFTQLQRSVWVYPYDCEDTIILLKADFSMGRDVLYIIADRIENDVQLRRHFNLV